jgi:hypothetical protein
MIWATISSSLITGGFDRFAISRALDMSGMLTVPFQEESGGSGV